MKARLVLALLCCAAALPARAGLFDDEEARVRVDKLRTEFDELAKRVDTTAKNQIDFANQAELLKSDVAKLRGQIEVILYELDATQKRQKDFYVDLDSRLRKFESGGAGADAGAGKPQEAKADPANEMHDYEMALTAFKGGKYKEALPAFQAFIKNYPSSTLAPSAHYWAASCLYQGREYIKAGELFGQLATGWPNDAKAPDALLAQANALLEGGDAKGGRKALETLVEKYPASSAAASAKTRLKALSPAKRK